MGERSISRSFFVDGYVRLLIWEMMPQGSMLGRSRKTTLMRQTTIYKKNDPRSESRFSWATWIRTKNDRTRICSVTITP